MNLRKHLDVRVLPRQGDEYIDAGRNINQTTNQVLRRLKHGMPFKLHITSGLVGVVVARYAGAEYCIELTKGRTSVPPFSLIGPEALFLCTVSAENIESRTARIRGNVK